MGLAVSQAVRCHARLPRALLMRGLPRLAGLAGAATMTIPRQWRSLARQARGQGSTVAWRGSPGLVQPDGRRGDQLRLAQRLARRPQAARGPAQARAGAGAVVAVI